MHIFQASDRRLLSHFSRLSENRTSSTRAQKDVVMVASRVSSMVAVTASQGSSNAARAAAIVLSRHAPSIWLAAVDGVISAGDSLLPTRCRS